MKESALLKESFKTFSDKHLLAIYNVAKTRLRIFFKNPKDMIALRKEIDIRKL